MSLLRKEGVYYFLPFVRGDTEGFIMGFGLRRYGIEIFLNRRKTLRPSAEGLRAWCHSIPLKACPILDRGTGSSVF
jgi:hypothetical protein